MKNKGKIDGKIFLLLITIVLFMGMYIAGIVIFKSKGFAKPQVFLNLFISNAGLIVIAAGMTMVMITGGIDISVGSVVALTCMMLAWMMEIKGTGAVPALLTVLVMGTLFGLAQGFLIAYLKIQPFIVTLAGMFFARGMTAMISQEMISVKNELFLKWAKSKINLTFLGGTVNKKGVVNYPFIYSSVIIALVVLVLVFVVLRYTKFGRTIYAVGGNEQSALMMGLNVKRTKLLVYVINGFLCALGGFLFCLNTCAGFVEQAKGFEMEAIASAVIGGTLLTGGVGNVFGSLFGVLIKGTIETFITFQGTLSSWWTKITIAALLAFFIILQSLFAKAKEK
ncbi:ABC transporter permease subunit [Lacrimispora saccharolytica]|uniref:Inner-membrane translocator n=1 Tax=Lacrimispora saccharolytica (strain ATCC 35040 / DSM 2544 / NRCC 2533 / WM1) TaxID=610130 RepID=D9R207_LACSW|nr:ABC transporter permease [Lacrimispora saccharolytica]ADL02898.1 inner-membrane translocator [[Clostridium] saccharolyticum WM1]QRV18905.1 sugar ABC transporter permease YjfF [Lacrimispora saccharolytica]